MESQGDLLRDEALERVERGAPYWWKEAAMNAVRDVAQVRSGGEFTTDAVWLKLCWSIGKAAAESVEPRAMGAVMRAAQGEGICEPTDRTRKSVRPACHSRPIRVWRSLL